MEGFYIHTPALKKSCIWMSFWLLLAISLYPALLIAAESEKERKVQVGIFHAPPVMILKGKNPPTGLMIEYLNILAEKEGWDIIWHQGDWKDILAKAKNNEIDLVPFIAYSEERATYLDYSKESFLIGWGQIFTHNNQQFQTIIDFNDKTVAVVNNEIHGQNFIKECKNFGVRCNIQTVDKYDQAFSLLEQEKVDGVAASNIVGRKFLREYNILPTSVIFNSQKSFFATPKNRANDILNSIDNYIIKWRDDTNSPYNKLAAFWFNSNDKDKIPSWLISALYIASLIIFASLALSYFLRQQVKRKTAFLEDKNEQTQQVINLIPHLIYSSDSDGRVNLINQYTTDYFGLKSKNLKSVNLKKLQQALPRSKELFDSDSVLLQSEGRSERQQINLLDNDYDERVFNIYKTSYLNKSNGKTSLVTVGVDITDIKKHEKQIQHLSHHDPLTNLPNRILLNDRITKALQLSLAHNHYSAVLLIDFDNFNAVNENHGHESGNRVLQEVSRRLLSITNLGDTLARLTGDEFVFLLNEIPKQKATKHCEDFSKKILDILSSPLTIKGETINVTACIGILVFPQDAKNHDSIIPRATTAMRHAKRKGYNQYSRFSYEMEAAIIQHHLINNELKKALEDEQFVLFYQAQFSTDNNLPHAFEALIRWEHPEYSTIYPNDFIHIAEQNNKIIPIGYWVMENAIKQLTIWAKKSNRKTFVSINLSVIQIQDPKLPEIVDSLLKKHQVMPEQIEFEITETVLFQETDIILEVLSKLKQAGVRLSIDDFGTGYSSLSHLKQLPIDKIKIDRSFVKDILTDHGSQTIVKTILALAQELGLEIIAEGIENNEQVKYLEALGCKNFQGYYFSKPLEPQKVEARYLKKYKNT